MNTEIVPHFFPMATCQFKDKEGVRLCLYYQGPDDTIREHRTELDGSLVTTTIVDKTISVLPSTPLAVTFCDGYNGPEIHLFYLDKDLNICKCQWSSGKWSGYDVIRVDNVSVTTAPYSQLASTSFIVGDWTHHKLIVYYQDKKLRLREVWYYPPTDSWRYGHESIQRIILAGSSLAAGTVKSRPHSAWCYFQDPDSTFREFFWNHTGYFLGGYNPSKTYNFRPGSSVSCVHYGDFNIRVYNITTDNNLVENYYNWNNGHWSTATITKTTTNSSIATVWCGGEDHNGSNLNLRIFYQVGNQQIHEIALDGGNWVNRGIFVDNSNVPSVECYRGAVAAD